jgi:4-amino-4-deoxy-L-arabinose transferase-like glycosyltransferase
VSQPIKAATIDHRTTGDVITEDRTTVIPEPRRSPETHGTDSAAPAPLPSEPPTAQPPQGLARMLRRWAPQRRSDNVRFGRTTLALIVAVAALGYAWGVTSDGIHLYYATAVRSMSTNWHNFFFGAFDPGGTISLDKLPGGFWVQALLVRVFGLSTWVLVLPQVIAGVAAVYVLYRAVRRVSGQAAGLIAAAVLAVTPVTVTMARGDVPDGICVFLLVVAADATIRAIRTGRRRSLLYAAVVVGLAFQVKMIEAWLVLPGFVLAYLVGAPGSAALRWRRLAAAGAVLVVVSLSWMTVISLVSASSRPYVDGSSNNSVFTQVFQYNGIDRIPALSTHDLSSHVPYTVSPAQEAAEAALHGISASASGLTPSWHRLVTGAVGRDGGWLLPLALCVAAAGLLLRRRRPRIDQTRVALLLWAGWLIPLTIAFSASANLLPYYLGMLTPAIAALTGIGAVMAYRTHRAGNREWPQYALTALIAAEALVLTLTAGTPTWFTVTTVAVSVTALLIRTLGWRRSRVAFAATLAAALAGPAVCSFDLAHGRATVWDVPFAAHGNLGSPAYQRAINPHGDLVSYGGTLMPHMTAATWRLLRAQSAQLNRERTHSSVVIFGAGEASLFLIGGSTAIITVGGYTGDVNFPTVSDLRTMLDRRLISIAVVPGALDARANDPRIALLLSACDPVQSSPSVRLVVCSGFAD